MKRIVICMFFCVATLVAAPSVDAHAAFRAALAAMPATNAASTREKTSAASDKARLKAARRSAKSKASTDRSRKDKHPGKAARMVAEHAAGDRGSRDAGERAAAREQAGRDATADYIYRVSQLSAPIIVDAKACKRIGAHGESIYENC